MSDERRTLHVGVAGWSIPSRYAEAAPGPGSHFERYARRLNAAEINSSFYRPHQRKTYERWAASTPDHFRFSVKAPKAMSHERKFADCGALIAAFADQIGGLGDKLGAVLVQQPRSIPPDLENAGRFFQELRAATGAPIAFEPRHAAWFEPDFDGWLAEREVARVAADPAPAAGAGAPGGWKALRYHRWHGSPRIYYSDYDDAALAALAAGAIAGLGEGAAVWCVFDNTASGAALGNALTFSRLSAGVAETGGIA